MGAATLTYDLNGNLATLADGSGTTTFTWNPRDQVTGLTGPVTASFGYDAVGRRRTKNINGVRTDFLYDGLTPIQEGVLPATPTANVLTGLGIDEYLTRTDASGARHLLPDALGSTVALTDASGTVQTQYTYEPFGKTTTTGPASTNPFRFTGREDDGTGLSYYRARYYHPGLQRFIAEDPIGFAGGLNLYTYVDNGPVNYTDPMGYAKGGQQKLETQLPDGRIINTKTPRNVIERVLSEALRLRLTPTQVKVIEGILKVVKRGGAFGIILDLLNPRDAGAGSECPAGPGSCGSPGDGPGGATTPDSPGDAGEPGGPGNPGGYSGPGPGDFAPPFMPGPGGPDPGPFSPCLGGRKC